VELTQEMPTMNRFSFQELFPLGPDTTTYRQLTDGFVSPATFDGKDILKVEKEALTLLASEAVKDISHLLRTSHLEQLSKILKDSEASQNDKFVALELIKNANISAAGILPMCQDTGTAIAMCKKGQQVWTGFNDEEAISRGIFEAFRDLNLRFSQLAPLSLFEEVNTKNNLPAQIDIYDKLGQTYEFLFVAKGGGSANKTFLFQENPARLHPTRLLDFFDQKLRSLGTAACPPYHLAVVVGGTSAELNLKTVKLASCRYLDSLPLEGSTAGHAYRDTKLEAELQKLTESFGIGAQFGGKYFCHDVRAIRLPRHGASLPIGIGVSCSADRQALGKISAEGVFLEQLESHPESYLPEAMPDETDGNVVEINLNRPMDEIRRTLSKYPIKTRISVSGPMIVARDAAHARLQTLVESGNCLPDYFKNYCIYYAGPAKTPTGYATGSFGPTTAARMDPFVEQFQKMGASLVMLAKGNRTREVRDSCKKYGGFYLGSIGGPGARLANDCIKSVECIAFEDLGMEAIWKIEVVNFPAFIIVDDKGNDFFSTTEQHPEN
jgi:fumarate hydratase class I